MRGTSITLLSQVREWAEADLGFSVDYELLDFPTCQRRAAMEPEGYDVYEQCFHNLDIVWFWGALQPIDINRITHWDSISDLAKQGGISKYSWRGHGDAPVRKLYVQPGGFLGPKPSRHISMLPTVHNMDGFGYDPRVFGAVEGVRPSWSWLLDKRAKGRIGLMDEPAIGFFDAALAAEASCDLQSVDICNMTIAEINALMSLLEDRRRQGYLRRVARWRSGGPSGTRPTGRRAKHVVTGLWATRAPSGGFYRSRSGRGVSGMAWRGKPIAASGGAALGMAYEYLNWWLGGFILQVNAGRQPEEGAA